jgi:hypothetical protein
MIIDDVQIVSDINNFAKAYFKLQEKYPYLKKYQRLFCETT